MITCMATGTSDTNHAPMRSRTRFRDHTHLVRLLFICVGVELTLVLLDLTVNWFHWSESSAIRRLFNITREDGLASLFAVVQTFMIAIVLWATYFVTRKCSHRTLLSLGWLFLAVFFTYLAIDDGAKVHERIGTTFKSGNENIAFISYGWQYIMAPMFILFGAIAAGFLWKLGDKAIRRPLLIAAFACLGVAMLIDFVEGMDNGYILLLEYTQWQESTVKHFSKSLEEFLEMLGMSFFLVLFLENFARLTYITEIRFSRGQIRFINLDSCSV